jgi:hypothetical protein
VARIEIRGRLVEEENLGLAGQNARRMRCLSPPLIAPRSVWASMTASISPSAASTAARSRAEGAPNAVRHGVRPKRTRSRARIGKSGSKPCGR